MAARPASFDPGLTARIPFELRANALKESAAECRKWMVANEGSTKPRCLVRSLRYFEIQKVLVALMCMDDEIRPSCEDRASNGDTSASRWRRVNMAIAWEVDGDQLTAPNVAAADISGESDYERLGVYPSVNGEILYLPLRLSGTGAGNASRWYLLTKPMTNIFDTDAVVSKDIAARLPKGAELWKGTWPNPATLNGTITTYRNGDGNCCPSNGTASYALEVRNGVLRVANVKYTRPQK